MLNISKHIFPSSHTKFPSHPSAQKIPPKKRSTSTPVSSVLIRKPELETSPSLMSDLRLCFSTILNPVWFPFVVSRNVVSRLNSSRRKEHLLNVRNVVQPGRGLHCLGMGGKELTKCFSFDELVWGNSG